MRKEMKELDGGTIEMEAGSGNVFAELGLPHPEQELLRTKLTLEIYRLIRSRGLTQTEAGKILGIRAAARLGADAQPRRIVLGGEADGVPARWDRMWWR